MRSLRICLSLVLVLAACAATPPGSPNLQTGEPDLGVVALAAAPIDPTVNISSATPAATEAGDFFLQCATTQVGVLLSPICALIGLTHGAAVTAPGATLKDAERALHARIAASAPQQQLLEYASEYAKASGLSGISVLQHIAPIASGALPSYSKRERGKIDTVLEVTLTNIAARTSGRKELDYYFCLTARGRLIRVHDDTVLDTFERSLGTNLRTYEQWQADDAKLFKEEIAQVARDLAEGFIDEWLLVYHGLPPTPDAKSATPQDRLDSSLFAADEIGEVPRNELRPLYPKGEYSTHGAIVPIVFNRRTIIASNNLKPTFRWAPLPQSLKAPMGTRSDQISSIVYDLRLYKTFAYQSASFLGRHENWASGLPVRSFNGLTEPEFTLDAPLKPCTRYQWTVRARFALNGKSRATEWGSMPEGFTVSSDIFNPRYRGDACRVRHVYFYYPLITPSADGAKCK